MAKTAKTEQEEPLEKKLWKAADKLLKNMDAAEYKHVALGLIFLKYISDAFEEQYQKLVAQKSEGADPEDKNEYLADKIFFVPVMARWTYIQGRATQPTIGKDIDDAMDAIEKDNPSLRGVLPKVFAQEKLDKTSLGGLVNLVGSATLGTKEAQSKDVLGQVYEYFLGQFALAEGKKGGQFYTPPSIVRLLVEVLEPYEGRVFDPCCGSGGMFVQSEKFIKSHQDNYKKKGKIGLVNKETKMSEKRNISNKLFAELCNHFSNEINSPFEIRTFKKGEFIYRKGNKPKGGYFMKYGWVKIFRGVNEGDEVILRMLGHNEFIGYVSLLKDTPYPDNAQALGYCELYFFPRNVFLTLIHENNDFTRSNIQMLCNEISSSEKQIVDLHSKKIDSRLATLLLDLEQASENSPVHDDSLIRLPKKDLAKIINISPETLSRYLTRFQESGLIKSINGMIELLRKDKLFKISNMND